MHLTRRVFLKKTSIVMATSMSSITFLSGCSHNAKMQTNLLPNTGENMTPALTEALASIKASGGGKLTLAPGRYDFWPDGGNQEYLYISNNDPGDNVKLFDLTDIKNIEIDGQGAELIMHGRITPFVINRSNNILLKNFSIDWQVPLHNEGDIIAVDSKGKYIDLRIPKEFSYRVEHGKFYHTSGGDEGIKLLLEYSPSRKESEYLAVDNFVHKKGCKVQELEPGVVRFMPTGDFKRPYPKIGNRMLVMVPPRLNPAIFIAQSNQISINNVSIYHSGCMGIIGQLSGNITMNRVRVTPKEGSNRMVSTQVDATHFVACYGDIRYQDCYFSNHIDDAVNIHGTYTPIKEFLSPRQVKVALVHPQQVGVNLYRVGDKVSITGKDSMDIFYQDIVTAVDMPNSNTILLTFKNDLPTTAQLGDVLDNETTQANISMHRCYVGRNRARGTLFKTKGNIVIEDNVFHTGGSAIQIRGGVDHWYESGPVRSVLIRNNHFNNCKYGIWGDSVIDIITVVPKGNNKNNSSLSHKPYHKNITIEENLFDTFDGYLVHANRVGNLNFNANIIRKTNAYPSYRQIDYPVGLLHVEGFKETGNKVIGFDFLNISGRANKWKS